MSVVSIVMLVLFVGAVVFNTGKTAYSYGTDLEDAQKGVDAAQTSLDDYKAKYNTLQKALETDIAQLTQDTLRLSSSISDKQKQIRDLQSLFVDKIRNVQIIGLTLVFGVIFLFVLKKLKII